MPPWPERTTSSAGSGSRCRSPSWRRGAGTRSSSAAATTASPPPRTWRGPAGRSSCSSGANGSVVRARSSSPSPTTGALVSPCAYLVGLLHPLVIAELDLASPRLPDVRRADPHQWGPSTTARRSRSGDDPDRTAAAVAALGVGRADVDGLPRLLRRCSPGSRPGAARRRSRARHLARRRAGPRRDRARCSATTARRSTSCSTRRSPTSSSTTSATSGCGPPYTARASSARTPGRGTPAPRAIHARHSSASSRHARRMGLRRGRHGPGLVLPRRRGPRGRRRDRDRCGGDGHRARGRRRDARGRRARPGRASWSRTPTPSARSRSAPTRSPTSSGPESARGACDSPVLKVNCALGAPPGVHRRAAGRGAVTGRRSTISTRHRRHPGGVRGEPAAASPRPSGASSTSRPPTTRASHPAGKHTMSVFAQYAPYTLRPGTWDDAARGDRRSRARRDRPLRARCRRLVDRTRGPRPAGHRGPRSD